MSQATRKPSLSDHSPVRAGSEACGLAWLRALVVACVPLALLGCAVSLIDGQLDRVRYALSSSSLLTQVTDTTGLLDREGSVVYFQNEGGELALQQPQAATPGASAQSVRNATRREASLLFDKAGFSPRDAFTDAADAASLRFVSLPLVHTPKLTPYLYVVKTEDNTLRTAAALLVEELRGPKTQRTRYVLQLDAAYSLAGLSQLSDGQARALKAAVTEGFVTLIQRLQADDAARLGVEPKIVFTSDFLTPRLNLVRPGTLIEDNGQRVWVRSPDGVFGLNKAQIMYSPVPVDPPL